jgi:hypothetical protein
MEAPKRADGAAHMLRIQAMPGESRAADGSYID